MDSSASPSNLRPDAPYFKPDAAIFRTQSIPEYVPLYGTMHGTAYASHKSCTTVGLSLPTAVQQAAITTQVPVRPASSHIADLGILSPQLLAELEGIRHSVDVSGADATILCRCDGTLRWIPAHAREEEHQCIKTAMVGGDFKFAGEFPGLQDIKWSRVRSKQTEPFFQQSLDTTSGSHDSFVQDLDATSIQTNIRPRSSKAGHSAFAAALSHILPTYQERSPEEREQGREIVKDLWTSAYQGLYQEEDSTETAQGAYNGIADAGIERVVGHDKRLQRGWSL